VPERKLVHGSPRPQNRVRKWQKTKSNILTFKPETSTGREKLTKNSKRREMTSRQPLLASAVAALVAFGAPRLAAEVRYVVTDLGTLPGCSTSMPYSINNNGQVVGDCYMSVLVQRAFLYSGGSMTDLGTLRGAYSRTTAYSINAHGQIAGQSGDTTGNSACFWDGSGIADLGNMGGNFGLANGINDSGEIVGYCGTNGYGQVAFLNSNGVMTILGTLGGTNTSALGINNNGQIAGWSTTSDGNQHAFLYSAGTMTDLSTLCGSPSLAVAINQNGQIVGQSGPPNGQSHAFLYSAGMVTDLGTFPGYVQSQAYGINNVGQVVGSAHATLGPGLFRAFLFHNGTMWDLNKLISPDSGWALEVATGINDNGQIVGQGSNPAHQSHAFLLIPYTPATLAVSVSNSDLVLSWATNTLTFNLFQNSALSKSNWVAVTNTPIVTNGLHQVVIPGLLVGNSFFRLQSK
jgi:probable HAF family extracellular repeat protein